MNFPRESTMSGVMMEAPVHTLTGNVPNRTSPEAIGQVKFHVSLNVSDLPRSVAFYAALLGVTPAKVYVDYAKFEIDTAGDRYSQLKSNLIQQLPVNIGASILGAATQGYQLGLFK